MEQNFFEEIFQKINNLEAENKILKVELDNLNEENSLNIDKYMTINPTEKLNEVKDFQSKINSEFFSSKKNIDETVTDLIINFKDFDELNSMEITGDFTSWKKKPMEKVNIIFLKKCNIKK
jgi:hypothetical protein